MNRRIEELADRATDDILGVKILDKKKFAELIVRECTSLTLDHKSDDYYNGWLDYRDEIKKYFGVEE